MTATLARALLIGAPILLLLVLSFLRFVRTPALTAAFPMLGAACLLVMVVSHVAEAQHFFPSMGWGERHSPGHYVDMTSTWLGIAFLVAASLCPLLRRRGHSAR